MTSPDAPRPASSSRQKSKSREWIPRIWAGATAPAWFGLLSRNRFAVEWPYLHIAIIDSLTSPFNSLLGLAQDALFSRAIARKPFSEPPIFILGHWRTGTTLLHELLIQDERHSFPTSYQCVAPSHFLLTEWLATRCLSFMVPSRRPMDNMALGWDRPQEDEFALCNLGAQSPYLTMAFPNHPPRAQAYYELRDVTDTERDAWCRVLSKFMRAVNYRNPKRLVLKSPTHTWRMKVLSRLFPEARFVHIVRDPCTVYLSTVHLLKVLYSTQGFQKPRFEGLEEYVFNTFLDMHRALDDARAEVPTARFHELRYEDLVADPIGQLEAIYARLELGDFDPARPSVERYLERVKDYKTNRYELPVELHAEINRRWGEVIRRHGYWREPGQPLETRPAGQSRP